MKLKWKKVTPREWKIYYDKEVPIGYIERDNLDNQYSAFLVVDGLSRRLGGKFRTHKEARAYLLRSHLSEVKESESC